MEYITLFSFCETKRSICLSDLIMKYIASCMNKTNKYSGSHSAATRFQNFGVKAPNYMKNVAC